MAREKKRPSPSKREVFMPGDDVTIFSIALFRRPLIEGDATIVSRSPTTPDLYRVRFKDEHKVRERFVFGGDWQADPDAMLHTLLAHWRATITPEILAEFFPDDADPTAY